MMKKAIKKLKHIWKLLIMICFFFIITGCSNYDNSVSEKEKTIVKKKSYVENEKGENEMKEALFKTIKETILSSPGWDHSDIYAAMIIVTWEVEGQAVDIAINCNEESVNYRDKISEERWNYAFWDYDNEINIVPDKLSDYEIVSWLENLGVKNIGEYAEEDSDFVNGEMEVLQLLKEVVKELLEDEQIKSCIGEKTPILIHELEYFNPYIDTNIEINKDKNIKDYEKWVEMEELVE